MHKKLKAQRKSLSFEHKDFVNDPFLEALDEWVWEMDINGIHTYSNGAVEKILGYKVEEVIGYSTTKLWADHSVKNNISYFKESLSKGKGWKNFPAYFQHKNGSIKILESSAIPVFDKQGRLVGYRGIDRDFTQRVQNENELKTQQEHVKLINKILRHDLTNQLSAISSAIRLYEKGYELNLTEEIKKHLDYSITLIRDMTELENYLNKNRELKVYQSREVIQKVLSRISDINFTVKGNSRILADEMIFSVFENLIRNAIIHGNADRLEIEIKKNRQNSTITITDNGLGIPDEIKEKIFEDGFKYGSKGNTGLGLSIIRSAMERYKGEVKLQNNQPHKVVFELTFKSLG